MLHTPIITQSKDLSLFLEGMKLTQRTTDSVAESRPGAYGQMGMDTYFRFGVGAIVS